MGRLVGWQHSRAAQSSKSAQRDRDREIETDRDRDRAREQGNKVAGASDGTA